MIGPFSFAGALGRRPYAITVFGAAVAQYAVALAAIAASGQPLALPWWFGFSPLRALLLGAAPTWALIGALAIGLVVAWVQVASSVRRARDADVGVAWACLAAAPGLQFLLFAWLSAIPSREAKEGTVGPTAAGSARAPIIVGALVGALLTVAGVAVDTLLFGIYGWGLFLVSPFLVGLVTAFIVNHRREATVWWSLLAGALALAIGTGIVMLVAMEGLICLLMASPLWLGLSALGGLVGRSIATQGRFRRSATTFAGVSVLPLMLAAELLAPPSTTLVSSRSIEIAAPTAAVWEAVTHMQPIADAPAGPLGWGLAYPIGAHLEGEGVGAVRIGEFSTGRARETVTQWEPGRRLGLAVLSEPPSMREMSPYPHVNAPHVSGYFRTLDTTFVIDPLDGGRSRLTILSRHALDLEPALYWTPIARWAIAANKDRVLNHFARQAQARAAMVRH